MHFDFHRRNSRDSTNEFGEYAAYLEVCLQSEFKIMAPPLLHDDAELD